MGINEIRAAKAAAREEKENPKPKKWKRIKFRSKKQGKTMRILSKAYPVFLATRPDCEIRSPVCLGRATVVNHNKGRGDNVHNQEDWTPCCPPCNGYIEIHHAWAEERGFKMSRHKKTE